MMLTNTWRRSAIKLFYLLLTHLLLAEQSTSAISQKICIGTNNRLWYEELKDKFSGCTHIVGNLELFRVGNNGNPSGESGVDILRDLEEITGYLLIQEAYARNITFPNLRIIRGESLLRLNPVDPEYSLIVESSHNLKQLEFPSLREISKGSVGIFTRTKQCFLETIEWSEIMTGKDAEYHYFSKKDWSTDSYERRPPPEMEEDVCGNCTLSCPAGCWAEGEENCQQFTKQNCSDECGDKRCYGTNSNECCHLLCAGGCTGPSPNECLSCRYVEHEGECRESCPAKTYSFGPICVSTCPDGSLIDEDVKACVSQCPLHKHQQSGRTCSKLPPAAKKCRTLSDLWPEIMSNDINHFRNCTVLEGDIRLVNAGTFSKRHNFTHASEETAANSSELEVFSSVREISGTIFISHTDFTELNCFRNLEVIGGDLDIYNTRLQILNLRNLRLIQRDVHINQNEDLCNVESINWSELRGGRNNSNVHNNGDVDQCITDERECSANCGDNGCWGSKIEDCACIGQNHKCVRTCDVKSGHTQDGDRCVKSCAAGKYAVKGRCRNCHENCKDGCTGSSRMVGSSGCHSCYRGQTTSPKGGSTMVCLGKNESCPADYYLATTKLPPNAERHGIERVCIPFPTKIPPLLWAVLIILLIILAAIVGSFCYRKRKSIKWTYWISAIYKRPLPHSSLINENSDNVQFQGSI